MIETFSKHLNVTAPSVSGASGRMHTRYITRILMFLLTSYRFGHIARTLRALQSSTKTSLRIDDEGLLSLQFLMPSPPKPRGGPGTDEPSSAFIEFRVSACLFSSLFRVGLF